MNHKISIKNLGPIKDIKDFEIKKFNILIGKSGAGKSVLARAIFLFTYTFNEVFYFPENIPTPEEARNFFDNVLRNFFPQYFAYKIQYKYAKDLFITFERNGDKISVKFSPKLVAKQQKMALEMVKKIGSRLGKTRPIYPMPEDAPEIYNSLKADLGLSRTIFIPATRGVVADFDRSRLRLLNKPRHNGNLMQDNLLDKISEGDITLRLFSNDNMDSIENFQSLSKKYEGIAKGKVHKRHGGQIVLTTKDGQTLSIDQLSSGQKGVIPVLMLLQYIAEKKLQTLLIIEEPEAHLFPEDQAALLEKIAEVANKTDSKVFITTHSPFLLMEANNLMTAEESQYTKLKSRFLRYDDVQANSISNGKCKSIKDKETRLIDGRYIEDVTDKIMEEFDKIVESK